jgi:Peroxidase, family 2
MKTNATLEQDPAPPGEWQQPQATDHRSPCPALNALANGGYLPRSGAVTLEQLVSALSTRLGLPRSMGAPIAKLAMRELGKPRWDGVMTLDLAALFQQGFLEHDASLTRRDDRDRGTQVDVGLVDQLLSLSEDGSTLTRGDLAAAHQLRMIQSAAGGHSAQLKAAVLGTVEAALLFQLLRQGQGIPLADARAFLERERLPACVPLRKLGWGSLLVTVVQLAVMGNVPFLRASKRAREAAAASATAKTPVCPVAHTVEGVQKARGEALHAVGGIV